LKKRSTRALHFPFSFSFLLVFTDELKEGGEEEEALARIRGKMQIQSTQKQNQSSRRKTDLSERIQKVLKTKESTVIGAFPKEKFENFLKRAYPEGIAGGALVLDVCSSLFVLCGGLSRKES